MDPFTRSLTPESLRAADRTGDILVVDDNPANLLAIEAALGDFDGRVVRAQSGTDALRIALEHDFALVLLDVKMPSMGGFETAKLIRRRKRSAHTPIIFITAFGRDDADVLAAYALGAVDFLFKPIVPEVLRAKVSVFVELQRRAAEVARQAELLGFHALREHERAAEEARQRWESDALRSRMEQLAEADRHKDEFLAMLGHELRNPVVPIVTGVALLKERLSDPEANPEILRICATIERQTHHLVRLMDDLLDISRITSGKIELRKAPTLLGQVVEQAVASSLPFIDQRQHTLRIEAPSEPLTVQGDVVRLVQVVSNLLNNAARYTEPGGTITVRLSRREDLGEIEVADDGQGISEELLPHVFDLFVQERDSTGGGLGLGLTLAKRLVAMHDGTLVASSEGRGRGSRFTIRLRLNADATAAGPSPLQEKAGSGRAAKKLVIALLEDNEDIRDMMATLLIGWGHDLHVAADGIEGAELILKLSPDVALVDIGLPGLDGYGVATRVREQAGRDRTRLIAMTGFGQDSARARARAAGFDAHLVKPVDIDTLRNVLSCEEL